MRRFCKWLARFYRRQADRLDPPQVWPAGELIVSLAPCRCCYQITLRRGETVVFAILTPRAARGTAEALTAPLREWALANLDPSRN